MSVCALARAHVCMRARMCACLRACTFVSVSVSTHAHTRARARSHTLLHAQKNVFFLMTGADHWRARRARGVLCGHGKCAELLLRRVAIGCYEHVCCSAGQRSLPHTCPMLTSIRTSVNLCMRMSIRAAVEPSARTRLGHTNMPQLICYN